MTIGSVAERKASFTWSCMRNTVARPVGTPDRLFFRVLKPTNIMLQTIKWIDSMRFGWNQAPSRLQTVLSPPVHSAVSRASSPSPFCRVPLHLYLGAGTPGIMVTDTNNQRLDTRIGVSAGLLFKVCGRCWEQDWEEGTESSCRNPAPTCTPSPTYTSIATNALFW